MDKFIKDRLSTIVSLILGTGSGWGFTAMITAPELKNWLITIAVTVSFLLSLIISLSMLGKWSAAKRKEIMKRTVLSFFGFLILVAAFFLFYNMHTIKVQWANNSGETYDTVLVKGLFYTPVAKAYRDSLQTGNQYRTYPIDNTILEDAGYDIDKVWSNNARIYTRLILLFLYTLMIGCFIAGVTYATEAIVNNRKGQPN